MRAVFTLAKGVDWAAAWGGWLAAQRGRFVLFLPVFFGAGMLAYFAGAEEPGLAPAAVIAVMMAGLAVAARARPLLLAASLAVLCAALGFASARLAAGRAAPWGVWPAHAVVLQGVVQHLEVLPVGRRVLLAAPRIVAAPQSDPELARDAGRGDAGRGDAGLRDMGAAALPSAGEVGAEPAPLARDVRIRLWRGDGTALREGDLVRLRALVRPPPPPAYPGGWDMQREAFFTGLGGYGYALAPAVVLRAAPPGRWGALRQTVAARTLAALPGPTGAIAATLLTGDGSAIAPADRAAFAASGLSHLLAVAGLHIGIVMGLAFGAMRFLLGRSEAILLHLPVRRLAGLAALAAGFGYLLLTGGHVPIWRSFVMACLVALAGLSGRRALSLRGLALAACVILAVQPWQIMTARFQMSFAAVLVLAAGWEMLAPALAEWGAGRWWRRLALEAVGLAATSLLAGGASLPFAAYHFGSVGPYFVPANMLAVPLTAFWVMPWGMLALALMPLGLERWALAPMGWGIGGIVWIAHLVASWPAAVLRVPQMPGWGLACVGAGLVWVSLWRGRVRLAGLAPLLAGLASPFLAAQPDAVVTADAAVIAVRGAAGISVLQSARAGGFEAETPLLLWGAAGLRAAVCSAPGCDVGTRFGPLRLVGAGAPACRGAVAILAAVPLRGVCAGVTVVDRFTVYRQGSVALYLRAPGGAGGSGFGAAWAATGFGAAWAATGFGAAQAATGFGVAQALAGFGAAQAAAGFGAAQAATGASGLAEAAGPPQVMLVSDRSLRGGRPWAIFPGQHSLLPPAQTE